MWYKTIMQDFEDKHFLKQQNEMKRLQLEELRQEIMKGYEQSQRSKSKPFDVEAIKAEGRNQLNKKQ